MENLETPDAPVAITRRTAIADLPEFLTPREVQIFLGLSRATTYDWIRRGILPSVRLGNRLLRVPKGAVVALR